MRRIKAIYLIPVFLVLLIGAGAAAYYFLFKPQLEKVDTARKAWDTARANCASEEKDYEPKLKAVKDDAKAVYQNYKKFHIIQGSMPDLWAMGSTNNQPWAKPDASPPFNTPERKKTQTYYQWMATGKVKRELAQWIAKFKQPDPPALPAWEDMMGFESKIQDVKMFKVDFAKPQTLTVTKGGYRELTNAIRRLTGYDFFPMIINPSATTGGPIVVKVDRGFDTYDINNPKLSMQYTATAYCMTRGWDPMPDAETVMARMKETYNKPPQPKKRRVDWDPQLGPCPKLLLFISQPEMDTLKP